MSNNILPSRDLAGRFGGQGAFPVETPAPPDLTRSNPLKKRGQGRGAVSALRVLLRTRRSKRPLRKKGRGRSARRNLRIGELLMLHESTSSFVPVLDTDCRNHLSPGDIVMFRFPGAGQAATASPVPRPCLVLDIETAAGRRCAVLAPGFPARRPAGHDRAVSLGRRADYRAAGLGQPTRFPIRPRLLVPLAHVGFVVSETTGSPVVGRLPAAAMERLQVERARLHALRDIRADRRQTQARQPDRRQPVRGRDFIVERRYRRRSIPMLSLPASRSGI